MQALREGYKAAELEKRQREAELLELRKRLNSKDFTREEQVAELERLKREEGRRRAEIDAAISRCKAEWPEYTREEAELKEELQALMSSVGDKKVIVDELRKEAEDWR